MRTTLVRLVAAMLGTTIFMGGCLSMRGTTVKSVEQTLDAFHEAASRADAAAYFTILDDDGVFLGTDASERWNASQFRAYCEPYFAQGRGWTYTPRERHVEIDNLGDTAWADELLVNDKYGLCRGTSVLRRDRKSTLGWRIKLYSLSFLIPNDLAGEVTAKAKAFTSTP